MKKSLLLNLFVGTALSLSVAVRLLAAVSIAPSYNELVLLRFIDGALSLCGPERHLDNILCALPADTAGLVLIVRFLELVVGTVALWLIYVFARSWTRSSAALWAVLLASLCSPLALFLSVGATDIAAAALAVLGLLPSFLKGRKFVGVLLLAIAASITPALIPLLVLYGLALAIVRGEQQTDWHAFGIWMVIAALVILITWFRIDSIYLAVLEVLGKRGFPLLELSNISSLVIVCCGLIGVLFFLFGHYDQRPQVKVEFDGSELATFPSKDSCMLFAILSLLWIFYCLLTSVQFDSAEGYVVIAIFATWAGMLFDTVLHLDAAIPPSVTKTIRHVTLGAAVSLALVSTVSTLRSQVTVLVSANALIEYFEDDIFIRSLTADYHTVLDGGGLFFRRPYPFPFFVRNGAVRELIKRERSLDSLLGTTFDSFLTRELPKVIIVDKILAVAKTGVLAKLLRKNYIRVLETEPEIRNAGQIPRGVYVLGQRLGWGNPGPGTMFVSLPRNGWYRIGVANHSSTVTVNSSHVGELMYLTAGEHRVHFSGGPQSLLLMLEPAPSVSELLGLNEQPLEWCQVS